VGALNSRDRPGAGWRPPYNHHPHHLVQPVPGNSLPPPRLTGRPAAATPFPRPTAGWPRCSLPPLCSADLVRRPSIPPAAPARAGDMCSTREGGIWQAGELLAPRVDDRPGSALHRARARTWPHACDHSAAHTWRGPARISPQRGRMHGAVVVASLAQLRLCSLHNELAPGLTHITITLPPRPVLVARRPVRSIVLGL
jgi:hypothetical protein